MAKIWLIKYFFTEDAYKFGDPAFTETINGSLNFALNWAQYKLKISQFKFYDILKK